MVNQIGEKYNPTKIGSPHAGYVEVWGARTHNLKNINIAFPRNQLIVITGVSGSGKSSLAFDTIYAEGQRRYRESFSAYARSFLGNLTRPEVDKINGLSPVIAIEQKTGRGNVRSTVGTITEIYDFMRLLFARAADAYSYLTGDKMVAQDEAQLLAHLFRVWKGQAVTILAPMVRGRKGHHEALLKRFSGLGFSKVRVDGMIVELTRDLKLERHKKHDIALVIDHVVVDNRDKDRIESAFQLAMQYGEGTLCIVDHTQKAHYFSKFLMDAATGLAYDQPAPNLFSFNTPYGACPTCKGLGEITEVDMDAIIPDKGLSIAQGAILPLGPYKASLLFKKIEAILKFHRYHLRDPIVGLPPALLHLLLFGNVDKDPTKAIASFLDPFEGIISTCLKQGEREAAVSEGMGDTYIVCPDCAGTRLNQIGRSFKIHGQTIGTLSMMDLGRLQQWFALLPDALTERQQVIAKDIIAEITKRLQFLMDVGLHYLHLHRSFKSLSGGEAQRVRLATQVGTSLLGVLYILDEPSIGLHPRDNERLVASLKALRDMGNTVLVVEHDRTIMLEADYLIEMGPKAGIHGGEVVAAGSLSDFLAQPSPTAEFLIHSQKTTFPPMQGKGRSLILRGCSGHNLKNVTLTIPLGLMVCITGVSGSGKSSLIRRTLLPILQKHLYNSAVTPLPYVEALGLTYVDKVIEIDQMPIGRTPRSNPSTYSGMFTGIRHFFALLPEARVRGYRSGRFSFNLKEGRCSACEGGGIQRIEMGLLPEVYVSCQACRGKRYNRETLEVCYKGKSIADVLDMRVSDAISFFENYPSILAPLHALAEVGLGYLTLGQHATTLSGGEAQRVKLATELARKGTGNTLYILDEPSTGLHFQDVCALLSVLKKLTLQGNTVLVIEHNMDIIKVSDHIIDMGPEGGAEGGYMLSEGRPEVVATALAGYTGHYLKKELAMI